MTIEFQTNILKYLLQTPNSGQYFQYLDSSVFDLVTFRIAFDILYKYFKQYGDTPTPLVAEQLLQRDLDSTKDLPETISGELSKIFASFKDPLNARDRAYIDDFIVSEIQNKQADKHIMSYGDEKLSLEQLTSKLGQLSLIGQNAVVDTDGLLIEDRRFHSDDLEDGAPTFLHDLNSMTAAGGFYPPQLIVFASGPKHFKTGFIIKLAVEYARDGYKVYYADGENGKRSIRRRAKMSIMECTAHDLRMSGDMDVTLHNFKKYSTLFNPDGGDLFIDYWPANTCTVGDVKNRLAYIKDTRNWSPDIIIWDPIDHFLPTSLDDQRRDTRIQIQKVYHEVIAVNSELTTFAIAPSQVNKAAIDKKVFDMKDLNEDFGKVMNAHAVFAICATPEELRAKIRRIIALVQREGERYDGQNQCVIHVDEVVGKVQEVDKEAYYKDLEDD